MNPLVILFAFVALQACSSSSQEAQVESVLDRSLGTILNQEYAIPLKSKPVTSAPETRQHYGEDWPFIVDSGTIGCEDRLYSYHTYKLTEMT